VAACLGEVMNYEEKFVQLYHHRIYTREYSGEEPTIILMHDFPDNVYLYDRLVPHLSPRRIVTFDFLGWRASDKPVGYPYTATNQVLKLAAVVEQLQFERAVLVAHDASGPPAID
jgi:pimeloyl-ACP methyl ester carboxylesterase